MHPIKINQVKSSVYFLEGHGGNIGVLSNKEGVLLIDDQFSYLHDEICAVLQMVNNKGVKCIINTHWHVDHTNGNERFGEKGSVIIAHHHSADRMKTEQTIQLFNHKQLPYSKHGQPSITFEDVFSMNFGSEKILLQYMPHAHTNGDLVVYLKKENVVHTGDIFVTYGYPFIDEPNGGTIQGVIKAIKEILKVTNAETLFIPGHGKLSNRVAVEGYLYMLETIFQRIVTDYEKGLSQQDILLNHPTKGYQSEKINEAILVNIVFNNLVNAQ